MARPERSYYIRYQELAALARALPHYRDPTFLEKYALRYQTQLLKGRQAILTEHAAFEQDVLFVAFLTEVAPDVVEWHAWRMKALALAEQLDIVHQPEAEQRRQRLTPEEKEAKFEWKRQQKLEKLRVHAEDEIAKMLQRFELAQKLRERAEDLGIDDDQIELLEQQLMGDLQDDEDEHGSGFKRL
jgi:hypothetical protein